MVMQNWVSGIGRYDIIDNLVEKTTIAEDLRSPNQAHRVVSFEKFPPMHLYVIGDGDCNNNNANAPFVSELQLEKTPRLMTMSLLFPYAL